jgi:hypothetical protein
VNAFDPDRAPCWDEAVAHSETWSATGPDVLRAEKRVTVWRWVGGVAAIVLPVAVGVAIAVWG